MLVSVGDMDRFLARLFLRGISLVAFLGGTFAIYVGWSSMSLSLEALAWPEVEGVIVTAEAIDEGGGAYPPVVEYRYRVAGESYRGRGDQLTRKLGLGIPDLGGREAARSQADDLAGPYPRGTPVPVYYDPEDPAVSVLRPPPAWLGVFPLVLGILFVGLAIWWFHWSSAYLKRQPRGHRAPADFWGERARSSLPRPGEWAARTREAWDPDRKE